MQIEMIPVAIDDDIEADSEGFADLGHAMSNGRMSEMERCVTSMPIHLRFSFSAATTAVPQPQNGSRTTSPSLLEAWITRSNSSSGFCVG